MKWVALIPLPLLSSTDSHSGPDDASLRLTVENFSFTEVWLRRKQPDSFLFRQVELLRNGEPMAQLIRNRPAEIRILIRY